MTTQTPEYKVKQKNGGIVQSIQTEISDYISNIKLFTKNAKLYLLGSFLIGVNFHVFQLLLNLYLRELGYAESEIGYIISSRAVGMTIIAIPAAMLLSRVKLKPVLLSSCVLFGLFSLGLSSFVEFGLLISFSMLSGVVFAFYRVAGGPFYMRNSSSKERTHLFSVSFGRSEEHTSELQSH